MVREIGGIEVKALTANKNIDLLEKQIREFRPDMAAVMDEMLAEKLRQRLAGWNIKILSGMDGLIEAAVYENQRYGCYVGRRNIGIVPTFEP